MRLVWQWGELERELPPDWAECAARGEGHRTATPTAPRRCSAARTRSAAATRCACSSPAAAASAPKRCGARCSGSTGRASRDARARRRDGGRDCARAGADDAGGRSGTQPCDASRRTGPTCFAELVLRSSDHLEHAALLAAPLNPTRRRRARSRCAFASRAGSATARRRDGAPLPRAARRGGNPRRAARSSTSSPTRDNVATQGPVWRIGGRGRLDARSRQLDDDRAGLERRRRGRRGRRPHRRGARRRGRGHLQRAAGADRRDRQAGVRACRNRSARSSRAACSSC